MALDSLNPLALRPFITDDNTLGLYIDDNFKDTSKTRKLILSRHIRHNDVDNTAESRLDALLHDDFPANRFRSQGKVSPIVLMVFYRVLRAVQSSTETKGAAI